MYKTYELSLICALMQERLACTTRGTFMAMLIHVFVKVIAGIFIRAMSVGILAAHLADWLQYSQGFQIYTGSKFPFSN